MVASSSLGKAVPEKRRCCEHISKAQRIEISATCTAPVCRHTPSSFGAGRYGNIYQTSLIVVRSERRSRFSVRSPKQTLPVERKHPAPFPVRGGVPKLKNPKIQNAKGLRSSYLRMPANRQARSQTLTAPDMSALLLLSCPLRATTQREPSGSRQV